MFGVLGNYSHTSFLNVGTFNPTYARNNIKTQFSTLGALSLKSFFCAAYGFEGFAKTASESTTFQAPVEEAKPLLVAAAA